MLGKRLSEEMEANERTICYITFMKIRIRYFASLREILRQNEELLTLQEGASVADVRALLLARNPRLQPIMERSVCAVNHHYVSSETTLHDGDEIVFIPPVGGGCP
jgi:sulfur-carrier protein